MRKILLYIATGILFFPFTQIQAQDQIKGIEFEEFNVTKENNKAIIKMNVNLDKLDIKSTEMITLTDRKSVV